ncbi:MAG: GTP-binding protein [Firmicutes bacterium]|nr:GTP-binding protein [Bacillota bacterium]
MTKVDIFSGFLGAGKTTLIKKLISEAYKGEKLVLIENEFGDISVDSGFMKESGIQVNELNSGCICCTLFGDFQKALGQVIEQFSPDRILIEPSGVGKLGDVILAVQSVEGVEVNSATAVVDASKAKMYMKNFGEFYADQIEHAGAIVLSRTGGISEEKLDGCVAMLREMNTMATIVTTPWDELDGKKIQKAIEKTETLEKELEELSKIDTAELEEHAHHHHHHHHHDDDDELGEEHEHDDDEEEHEHHHHHHDEDDEEHEHHHHHDDDDDEHEHHHHHDEDDDEHEHHHHHDHDADEVFDSWGVETARKFSEDEIREKLGALDGGSFGAVLRAKGIVAPADGGEWIHFDYVPGEISIRRGTNEVTGRLCVIGAEIKRKAIKELFMGE